MRIHRWTLVTTVALTLLSGVLFTGAGESSCVPVEPVFPTLDQWDEVSGCGGFAAMRDGHTFALTAGGYCDAEVLAWAYDAAAETLTLHNDRVLLNCCGEHAMSLALVDGLYVARETDEPTEGGGRCHCMCVFDYHVEAAGVPAGVIALRLDRFVTETGEATVWEGALDLSEGGGVIVIDDTSVAPWCEE